MEEISGAVEEISRPVEKFSGAVEKFSGPARLVSGGGNQPSGGEIQPFAVEGISEEVEHGQPFTPPLGSGTLDGMADSHIARAPQLPFDMKSRPKPTGDIWEPSKSHPATVAVPLPVVMVRVEGPFTALDRKIWLLLLHHAWDELDTDKPYHEISVAEVLRLFRKFGRTDLGTRGKIKIGRDEEETEAAALWDSIRRLVKTTVEWEDEDYQGISALISEALLNKRYRETGRIHYAFGKGLSRQILAPRSFARLRCHVILALRSKYAVTLYEILEAYINRRDSTLLADMADLRSWLKVPEESYPIWRDFRRFVLDPAVNEINEHADEGGFYVAYEGQREGKAFTKVKFTVSKSATRDDRDQMLQGKAKRARDFAAPPLPFETNYQPTDEILERLRTLAPGWDRQGLVARYGDWMRGKPPAQNPHGAFLGWVKRFTKGKPAE